MESGGITDEQITASSVNSNNTIESMARLNHVSRWLPSISDTNHWINIDLRKNQTVTGLITQGYGNWVASIYVQYEQPAGSGQLRYIQDDDGNTKVAFNVFQFSHLHILITRQTWLFPESLPTWRSVFLRTL